MKAGLCVIGFLMLFSLAPGWCWGILAPAEEQQLIAQLNQQLHAQNLGWTAGKTSVSRLSLEEFRQLCGCPLDQSRPLTPPAARPAARSVPGTFDWRNHNGNWITSPKQQGQCQSCVAFASVGCVEALLRIASQNPNLNVDLSEQHLFSCGTVIANQLAPSYYLEPNNGCEGGWLYSNRGNGVAYGAFDYLLDHGVPDEACNPYQGTSTNCGSSCGDWQSRATKVQSYQRFNQTSADLQLLKQNVYEQGPAPVVMMVFQDMAYYTGGIYQYNGSASPVGGHAVLVIGWDDSNSCFIVKNSWDTSWGEGGFFRIHYNQCSGQARFGIDAITASLQSSGAPTHTPGPAPNTPIPPTSTRTPAHTVTVTPTPGHGACQGDGNGDRFVNGDDFRAVRDNFGQSGCARTGDTNSDCFVNGDDFRAVRDNFGRGCP